MSHERPHITIYTDGGAMPNPGPGGWGVVLIGDDDRQKELSGAAPDTTNNRMELTAAIEALRALNGPSRVTLYTDSQYLRRGITEWLPGWIARGWRRKGDQPVQNADLWRALHAETQRHIIDWQWVKGHAGHTHNERVDQLATAARQQLTGSDTGPAANQPASLAVAADYEIALRISVLKHDGPGGWALRIAPVEGGMGELHTGHVRAATAPSLILTAAREALEHAPADAALRIICADDYLYSGITDWIHGWQKRGWRTASKKPVKHRALWQALLAATEQRTVEWVREGQPPPALARGLDKLAHEAARHNQ